MQEPLFGAFLHHFLSNPRKAVRIRGACRIARVRPAGFSPGGACTFDKGRAGFGPLSDEVKREARSGRRPSCFSSPSYFPKGNLLREVKEFF